MPRFEIGPHTSAPGPRKKYKDFIMHAEDGLIVLEDQIDGYVRVLTCPEAHEKLVSFAKEANFWDKARQNVDPQKRAYAIDYYPIIRGLVEMLSETIKEAKQQGDPEDRIVRKQKLLNFLRTKAAGTGRSSVSAVEQSLEAPDKKPIIFTKDSSWLARGPKDVDERY